MALAEMPGPWPATVAMAFSCFSATPALISPAPPYLTAFEIKLSTALHQESCRGSAHLSAKRAA